MGQMQFSAVLQTARHLKTAVQRGTKQIQDSIAEKTKRKLPRKDDAWTIAM
jgi:hypothetical protein